MSAPLAVGDLVRCVYPELEGYVGRVERFMLGDVPVVRWPAGSGFGLLPYSAVVLRRVLPRPVADEAAP